MHEVPVGLHHYKSQTKTSVPAVQAQSCYKEKICLGVTVSKSQYMPWLHLLTVACTGVSQTQLHIFARDFFG